MRERKSANSFRSVAQCITPLVTVVTGIRELSRPYTIENYEDSFLQDWFSLVPARLTSGKRVTQ